MPFIVTALGGGEVAIVEGAWHASCPVEERAALAGAASEALARLAHRLRESAAGEGGGEGPA